MGAHKRDKTMTTTTTNRNLSEGQWTLYDESSDSKTFLVIGVDSVSYLVTIWADGGQTVVRI